MPELCFQADKMKPGETISTCFGRLYDHDFGLFFESKFEKVVLIDEAQLTYNDRQLWPGMRLAYAELNEMVLGVDSDKK
ncbi:hypothetical protein PPTG_24759, partial [Phytophthora nicotianae INRA-310]